MLLHISHWLHGFSLGSAYFKQFNDLANILALEVFPVPLGPLNKYAGAIFLVTNACLRVIAIRS